MAYFAKDKRPILVGVLLLGLIAAVAFVWLPPKTDEPVAPSTVLQPSTSLEPVRELIRRRDINTALWTIAQLPQDDRNLTEVLLLQAECQRHLRDARQLDVSLKQAREAGAPENAVRRIELLDKAQSGATESDSELIEALIELGASTTDAKSAVILGMLVRRESDTALPLIDQWESAEPKSAEVHFLKGMYWQSIAKYAQAETELQLATEMDPRHELAQVALVDLYSGGALSLEKALGAAEVLAKQFPHQPTAVIRLSRLLRRQGRVDEALQALDRAPRDPSIAELVRFERSELAFDQGRYEDAQARLAEVGLRSPTNYQHMLQQGFQMMMQGPQAASADALFQRAQLGALAYAYAGQRQAADEVFDLYLDRIGRLRRINDLYNRMRVAGEDPRINQEVASLKTRDGAVEPSTTASSPSLNSVVSAEHEQGLRIYVERCAHCHGEAGDGQGKAARHLFPRPRDFKRQRFRFVTASTATASDADLVRTIQQGLPGTSMPAYPELNSDELKALVQVLRAFQTQGLVARYRAAGLAESEAQQRAVARMQVGSPLELPASENSESAETTTAKRVEDVIERGRPLFVASGCQGCHSLESTAGDEGQELRLFDESGLPVLSRNLKSDPFKGGDDAAAIYARLALGIPGTPHPSVALEATEILDLAHFVRSLRQQVPQPPSTNYARRSRLECAR